MRLTKVINFLILINFTWASHFFNSDKSKRNYKRSVPEISANEQFVNAKIFINSATNLFACNSADVCFKIKQFAIAENNTNNCFDQNVGIIFEMTTHFYLL